MNTPDKADETNPPTLCGKDHPADLYCELCTMTLGLRARFLAVPVYDINYLVPALLEQDPTLKDEVAPFVRVLTGRGYTSRDFIVLDVDDVDDDASSYGVWVRALIELLGAHEVANSYFRIGE